MKKINKKIINIKDFINLNINQYNFLLDNIFLNDKTNLLFIKKLFIKNENILINGLNGYFLRLYLNISLLKNNLLPIFRNYKIVLKNIGCNAKCPICIDWKKKGNIDLQKEIIDSVIDKIISENITYKNIQVLGGEPLLIYDKIIEVIKKCKKNNIKLDFPTNGSLLDIDKINKMIEAGLDNFTFSVDFPNIKHDNFRSLSGAFNKIIFFTDYLMEKNIKVQWNTVIGKHNYKEIIGFKKLYLKTKPSVHNFIKIDENYIEANNLLKPNKIQTKAILESFNLINDKDIKYLINGFTEDNHLNKKNCFVPFYMKTYYIGEEKYYTTPCYSHSKINNLDIFYKNALSGNCKEYCDLAYLTNNINTYNELNKFNNLTYLLK